MNLSFALPREAFVHVGVVDLQGREVLTLAHGVHPAGRHALAADERTALAPGLYFVRMTTGGRTLTSRFVVAY